MMKIVLLYYPIVVALKTLVGVRQLNQVVYLYEFVVDLLGTLFVPRVYECFILYDYIIPHILYNLT